MMRYLRGRNSVLARRFASLGLASLAAFGTDARAADDVKYFNGSFCRAIAPFGTSSNQGLLRYSGKGMVFNASLTQPVTVGCPIVRDILDHDNGWDSLEIGYSDRSAGSVECSAFSGSPDGTLAFSQVGSSVNTVGTLWSKVNMTFGGNGSGFDWGFYYIQCVIPPAKDTAITSGIGYYRIGESS